MTILLIGYTLVMALIGSVTYVTTRDVISFAVGPVILTVIMPGIIYLIYRYFPWVPHGHKDLLKSLKQRRAAPDAPFKTYRKALPTMMILLPAGLAAICVALYFATKNIGVPFAFIAMFAFDMILGMILGRIDGRKRDMRRLHNAAMYGSEKPGINAKPIVTNGEVADAVYRYEEQWTSYLLYRTKAKDYNRNAVFTSGDADRILFLKSTLPRMICIILSVAICAAQTIYFALDLTNMLRADKTDGITIGMRVSDLPAAMGSPYESAGGTLKYYDRRYTYMLKRNDDFDIGDIENTDDLEDAIEQAGELETTKFAYMEIGTGTDDLGNDIVISVFFDPSRTRRETERKYVESVRSDAVLIARHAATATVTVYIDYTDGSLFKCRTEAALKSGESTDDTGETVTLTFYDAISGSTIELEGTVI